MSSWKLYGAFKKDLYRKLRGLTLWREEFEMGGYHFSYCEDTCRILATNLKTGITVSAESIEEMIFIIGLTLYLNTEKE